MALRSRHERRQTGARDRDDRNEFSFPTIWFDQKAERRRTSFNIALKDLGAANEDTKKRFVNTIQGLAGKKFPPAMYLPGCGKRGEKTAFQRVTRTVGP